MIVIKKKSLVVANKSCGTTSLLDITGKICILLKVVWESI